MKHKTAVLLLNVGSPDTATVSAVRRYLTEFLNDKRVIDLPWLLRKFLVNLIIIPFRVKNSTRLYQQLWTEKGSPLIYLTQELQVKLQQKMAAKADIFIGMRYGNPGYKEALKTIKEKRYEKLILLPLFPQHAMSTTETALVAAENEIKKLAISAEVIEVGQFYDHPEFIASFVKQAQKYDLSKFDHVVFSYHGLPNRQVEKCHPGIRVEACNCNMSFPEHGKFCYRATCFETSRLIAKELKLKSTDYTVAFQSRLSKNWLTPFTDKTLTKLIDKGKKKVLVLAPSFVTDCLETILEIGVEYGDEFRANGGVILQMVDSLNAEDYWVNALTAIISEKANIE